MIRRIWPILVIIALAFTNGLAAQDRDSLARGRLGCPHLNGTWSLSLTLDSAANPHFKAGRTAVGQLRLGGPEAWAPSDPNYPCRHYGHFDLDQRPLWGRSLHPMVAIPIDRPQVLQQVATSWMGGPGAEDSIVIDLAAWLEPGTIELRGQVRRDSVIGTWYLITGHQGPKNPTLARGHLVITRGEFR